MFGSPLVKGSVAHATLAAQIRDLGTLFILLEVRVKEIGLFCCR